jgi:hypothetical protein
MSANPDSSTEGNDPYGAVFRLARLVDQMIQECPDAVILVAMPISTTDQDQQSRTAQYQSLIPKLVQDRRVAGYKVLAADFTSLPICSETVFIRRTKVTEFLASFGMISSRRSQLNGSLIR